MTMNSWKSVESWACLPPLRMLNIGTGSVRAPDAAEVAVERQAVRRGGGVGAGERDAEDRVRARARALLGVPSSSISSVVDAGLVGRVQPEQARRDRLDRRCATAVRTPLPP